MKLSRLTVGWGIYIVISAAFMLQVRKLLFNIFGDAAIMNSLKAVFLLVGILSLIYAVRLHVNIYKICAAIGVVTLGYFFAMWQPYFSEKTHVLTYGFLGYLTSNDLIGERRPRLKNLALAVWYIALISAMDEGFQRLLPYRVGDLRDFITNVISGILGLGLFFTLRRNR
ncbi:MAG: hypothetical protein A2987_02920 [Omnitrophica bacterium RIFCSPLOWO2_01_FULL_45_10]|nr:MAG: hypothetical protein A2987_02920 [Omnitrophica bacterium RIFCSPLOWO2_01_FULL_45_10]